MKLLLTIFSLAAIISSASATVITVTCQNNPTHFLPVTVNAVCDDTIRWVWVSGTHVVGPINSSNIPNGAAMFNAPIDAGHLSFQYVVTFPGNYNYQCLPATPHGEPGYIVVNCSTGIPVLGLDPVSAAYPNPASDKFTIETSSPANMISIYNLLGEKIKSVSLKIGQTNFQIDVADLNKGVYFYSIINEGVIVETKKLVKE